MKVVLFCGGLGMRLRDYSESIPKPMVPVGYRPILWHVMRYYAHFGHKDFILCLGYKADSIKQYFLKYDETISNDFVMSEGGREGGLARAATSRTGRSPSWTPASTPTSGCVSRPCSHYLQGEEMFLANYSDGVSDLPLPDDDRLLPRERTRWPASSGVAPTQSFHLVSVEDGGRVKSIRHVKDVGMRINGGFFVLRREIFDWMKRGRGARPGALPAPGRGGQAARLPLRRLLGVHGHLQGQAAPRGPLLSRAGSLGGLEGAELCATGVEGHEVKRVSVFEEGSGPKRVLALGAHADDIEIGCGGTILRLVAEHREARGPVGRLRRDARAREGGTLVGRRLPRGCHESAVAHPRLSRRFPSLLRRRGEGRFRGSEERVPPDLIFTHYREDRHQDHRLISELTWNTWRDHLILEYEIPKYDGDFGSPNFFASLPVATLERKIELVLKHFTTQAGRPWFTADLFRAAARIRGMECAAPEGHAEGFYCRKARF